MWRREQIMNINQTELIEFIRGNRRLANILEWEANHVRPRAWGPRLAVRRILENPKRREKVKKELDKYAKSVGMDGVNLEAPAEDSPFITALVKVIQDFRTEWELGGDA